MLCVVVRIFIEGIAGVVGDRAEASNRNPSLPIRILVVNQSKTWLTYVNQKDMKLNREKLDIKKFLEKNMEKITKEANRLQRKILRKSNQAKSNLAKTKK